MAKSFDNKKLLYLLGALIILFLGIKWYQKNITEKTLSTELFKIDTSKVTELYLYPVCEKNQEILFYKEGKEWKVKKDKIIAETDNQTIKNLLSTLKDIKVKSLVTKDKNKWSDYQVTDSTATRVKIVQGKKIVADVYIGRFSYEPSARNYGMYGGGGVMGTTYIRPNKENEVYAVDGFLVFTFNQNFNSFRKLNLTKFETSQVEKLIFKYPGDSSFTVELKNNKWMIDSSPADSSKVVSFINRISYKSSTNFNDNFNPQENALLYSVTIQGKNINSNTIEAYAWKNDTMVVNSSANPKSWFNFNITELKNEIFVPKASFLPDRIKRK